MACTPLQNTTTEVVNTGVTGKRGRKRKNLNPNSSTQPTTRKRQKANASAAQVATVQAIPSTAAVCGVGPPSLIPATPLSDPQAVVETSTAATGALLLSGSSGLRTQMKQPSLGTRTASDVWYFMWAINSPEKPEKMPEDQLRFMSKPNSPYVACRLCG